MSSVPFHYVDLRTFCYATEDEKRVADALRTFLPEEFEVDRVVNAGHHGDRIVVLSARVERADDVRHVLSKLSKLPEWDRVLAELSTGVADNTSLLSLLHICRCRRTLTSIPTRPTPHFTPHDHARPASPATDHTHVRTQHY